MAILDMFVSKISGDEHSQILATKYVGAGWIKADENESVTNAEIPPSVFVSTFGNVYHSESAIIINTITLNEMIIYDCAANAFETIDLTNNTKLNQLLNKEIIPIAVAETNVKKHLTNTGLPSSALRYCCIPANRYFIIENLSHNDTSAHNAYIINHIKDTSITNNYCSLKISNFIDNSTPRNFLVAWHYIGGVITNRVPYVNYYFSGQGVTNAPLPLQHGILIKGETYFTTGKVKTMHIDCNTYAAHRVANSDISFGLFEQNILASQVNHCFYSLESSSGYQLTGSTGALGGFLTKSAASFVNNSPRTDRWILYVACCCQVTFANSTSTSSTRAVEQYLKSSGQGSTSDPNSTTITSASTEQRKVIPL